MGGYSRNLYDDVCEQLLDKVAPKSTPGSKKRRAK
jgi:hypothetical protein